VLAKWIGIASPNAIFISINEVVKSFPNHHPEIIQDLLTLHPNSKLEWVEEFRILVLQTSNDEGFAFNLSRGPIELCSN
jgi:hypothetical protein